MECDEERTRRAWTIGMIVRGGSIGLYSAFCGVMMLLSGVWLYHQWLLFGVMVVGITGLVMAYVGWWGQD